jgi:integrase
MLRTASETRHGPGKGASRRSFGRLRKERSGRWSAAYIGPDAVLHRAPTTFEAKDDATAWLVAERRLIEADSWTSPEDRTKVRKTTGKTFGDFASDWLETRRTRSGPLKPRTRADYQRLLDRHLIPAFGTTALRSITPAKVEAWYEGLNANTPTERAHAYQLLRAIMTSAAQQKLVSGNPCQIRDGGFVRAAHKVEPATLDELATIVNSMPERLQLAVLLGSWCALRYGEITELRRKDVALKRGIVHVRRGVTWVNGKAVVGTPKTAAGIRDVAIPPHLYPVVKAHLDRHVAPGPNALLFPSASGENMHPRTFGNQFNKARTAAGRPDLHFHDLRHTGAVLAAQTGATLAELMLRLGHSTPGAAMRYQHAARDRDAAIAAALSKMVEGI